MHIPNHAASDQSINYLLVVFLCFSLFTILFLAVIFGPSGERFFIISIWSLKYSQLPVQLWFDLHIYAIKIVLRCIFIYTPI